MIDIHSHILPGLDDGPANDAEAVDMLRIALAAGTTDIVASPHANPQYRFDPVRVVETIARLQSAVGPAPCIHSGCELHLTPENIESACTHPGQYSIAGNGYLLIEFHEAFIPKTVDAILNTLMRNGLRPVIAHPERNRLLRRHVGRLSAWIDGGCVLQLTAQSLEGEFGRSACDAGWNLLRRGLVHVIASDAHDCARRPPVLDKSFTEVSRRMGQQAAETLFLENPGAVLGGKPIRPRPAVLQKRNWFDFLAGR